ncbi:MAG: helix-turn-helix transcriptional regulator [Chloroflexota bacterium]
MAQIQINFNNLLARVELETGNRPTQREIAEATGVAESTLSRFAQGKTGRFDEELLVKLVDYFDSKLEGGCTLGDLMSYPPVEGQVIIEHSAFAAVG